MSRSIRFAVVGLGQFAQSAILPAIHRQRGASVTALVSTTPTKLDELGARYDATHLCDYARYDELLDSRAVDAVYLALPSHLHADAAIRAAEHGIHVLVEQPLAASEAECRRIVDVCRRRNVRLMVGYRLHFQQANLHVVDLIKRDVIGTPRLFSAVLTLQLRDDDPRLEAHPGAGPLFDIGVQCVNAARHVLHADPVAVQARRIDNPRDPRFAHVEEGVAVTMWFAEGAVAQFMCSYGAGARSHYDVVGTEGAIEIENAFAHDDRMITTVVKDGRRKRRTFRKTDQVAAVVRYFVRCVRNRAEPERSGAEGCVDVRIVLAIHEAARTGAIVRLGPVPTDQPVNAGQAVAMPANNLRPTLVSVAGPRR